MNFPEKKLPHSRINKSVDRDLLLAITLALSVIAAHALNIYSVIKKIMAEAALADAMHELNEAEKVAKNDKVGVVYLEPCQKAADDCMAKILACQPRQFYVSGNRFYSIGFDFDPLENYTYDVCKAGRDELKAVCLGDESVCYGVQNFRHGNHSVVK